MSSDKEEFFEEPVEEIRKAGNSRRNVKRGCFRLLILMVLCSIAFAVLCVLLIDVTNSGGKIKRSIARVLDIQPDPVAQPKPEVQVVEKIVEVPVEKIVEKIVEVEKDRPMPSSYVPWQTIDTAKLWNGLNVTTKVTEVEGQTASLEREKEESYQIKMELKIAVPQPNDSVGALGSLNPNLPNMFTDFSELVENATVSPFYYHLYELKTDYIQKNVTRLDRVLSRHNLYDCETILEIKHPESGRKALMIQGEMDVVADGSDGDRVDTLDDYISMSDYYQPFTSYGWPKQTDTPNPLLERWETKLKEYETEFAIKGLSIERNRELREGIEKYSAGVADMKGRSFLIAEMDPFIVIPLSLLGRKDENEFGPAIGDYAVVIYGDKLYPAIAGDAGPSYKMGEASLRLAKALNEKASPYNRPVSDLQVTYLIFPDSADEKKGPPNLEAWHEKCSALLDELGGIEEGFELHQWEDLVAKLKAEKEAAAKAAEEAAKAAEEAAKKAAEEEAKPDAPDAADDAPEESSEGTDSADAAAEN